MSDVARSELLQEALKLSAEERLALAKSLWDSVERPEDPEWRAAWTAEVHRRLKGVEDRTTKTIPWTEARARILERLKSE